MPDVLLCQGNARHLPLTDARVPTRPVLRYPGGKWLLAPWILQHCPPHTCYVEPFAGAGSVFMQKPRSYAEVLNDLDGELVTLFQILRDPEQAQALERLLRLTPYAVEEYMDAYHPADTPLEQTRRLLIRCWQGFNGEGALGHKNGWRYCSTRRGTLPSHDWGTFPQQITAYTARLQGVILEHAEALTLCARYDSPETLWYVDPPYVAATCPAFHGYRHTIDHTALAEALHGLRGMVVLSGYQSSSYESLYADWQRVTRQAYAGSGKGGRRTRTESLWLNPACQRRHTQLSLFGGER
jgi:DNA adenine methylase